MKACWERYSADVEVIDRPLRLRAIQCRGWHIHFAQAVFFDAYITHGEFS